MRQLLQQTIQESCALLAARDKSELLVETVHRFQGDRDVMFFSPVVSEGTPVGVLTYLRRNGNLFNVAITRTRGLLYVIGDRSAAASWGVNYFSALASYVAGISEPLMEAAPGGNDAVPRSITGAIAASD